jgi:hypothetical protein
MGLAGPAQLSKLDVRERQGHKKCSEQKQGRKNSGSFLPAPGR